MTNTPNYLLEKPDGNDYVDVSVLNGNMDKIDEALDKMEKEKAAAGHTHTLAALGAAAAGHTHTASDVGAAASDHTHTLSALGAAAASHTHAVGDITSGTLPVARGGTGLTASPSMLTNLGTTSAANILQTSPRPGVTGTLPVANGGTGAATAAAALTALGAAAASHNHSAASITSGTLPVARGGTGVASNPSMLTNLGSTSAASVFAASPRPGVTGVLPVANGGTGVASLSALATTLEVTKVVLGSYFGTDATSKSLTFETIPKLILVNQTSYNDGTAHMYDNWVILIDKIIISGSYMSSYKSYMPKLETWGTTVTWSCSSGTPSYAFNALGSNYQYVAFL